MVSVINSASSVESSSAVKKSKKIDANIKKNVKTFSAKINIHVNSDIGELNKRILGNNIIGYGTKPGHKKFNKYGGGILDSDTTEINQSYVDATRKAGIRVLRWPGGNTTESLEWKKLIGPKSVRQEHTFGLNEFLLFCKRVGAVPVITLPTDKAKSQDIVDLVEYLNSPSDGSNKLGGTDWAKLRASHGYRDPWAVVWFEYGNETFYSKKSIKNYVQGFSSAHHYFKLIDPKIKLGAVLEDSENFEDGWTSRILKELKDKIDYVIVHPYLPKVNKRAAKQHSREYIAMAAIAADADLIYRFEKYNAAIRKLTGRNDIKLAVTEYNGQFIQDQPIPYRHTLVNAVHNADYIRIMLQPTSNVVFANFWHLNNSYWGMLTGGKNSRDKLVKEPNYYVFYLYNKYTGNRLISLDSVSPAYDFKGGLGLSPRRGIKQKGRWTHFKNFKPEHWEKRYFSGGSHDTDTVKGFQNLKFHGTQDVNFYHLYRRVKVKPNSHYRIRVPIRTRGIKNGKVGLAVEDNRGWKVMHYQPSNIQLTGTNNWTNVSVNIRTLGDTKKLKVMVRRISGNGKLSGEVDVGKIEISQNLNNFGPINMVEGLASIDRGKGEVYLLAINKSLGQASSTLINLNQKYKVLEVEHLEGPSPYSTNRENPDNVGIKEGKCAKRVKDTCELLLPPMSITGVRMKLL